MVSKSSKAANGRDGETTGRAEETGRAEQLAKALRDNLRRRKSQARARQDGEPGGQAAPSPGNAAESPTGFPGQKAPGKA